VQDVEYKSIRGILAQESGFFKARFFGANKPTPDHGRVVVDGVTTSAWKAVRLWFNTASVRATNTVFISVEVCVRGGGGGGAVAGVVHLWNIN